MKMFFFFWRRSDTYTNRLKIRKKKEHVLLYRSLNLEKEDFFYLNKKNSKLSSTNFIFIVSTYIHLTRTKCRSVLTFPSRYLMFSTYIFGWFEIVLGCNVIWKFTVNSLKVQFKFKTKNFADHGHLLCHNNSRTLVLKLVLKTAGLNYFFIQKNLLKII